MLRRLLQWYERRQPKAMVVILAPEVTDPKPAVVTLNLQPGARILEAGSQAALGQLQRVGARYDLAYRQ